MMKLEACFDPLLLQPLGSTIHIPAVRVAQKLVDNVAMMRSW